MPNHGKCTLKIEGFPKAVLNRVKARAAERGLTLKECVLRVLTNFVVAETGARATKKPAEEDEWACSRPPK